MTGILVITVYVHVRVFDMLCLGRMRYIIPYIAQQNQYATCFLEQVLIRDQDLKTMQRHIC